jgi:hypothetical protein
VGGLGAEIQLVLREGAQLVETFAMSPLSLAERLRPTATDRRALCFAELVAGLTRAFVSSGRRRAT